MRPPLRREGDRAERARAFQGVSARSLAAPVPRIEGRPSFRPGRQPGEEAQAFRSASGFEAIGDGGEAPGGCIRARSSPGVERGVGWYIPLMPRPFGTDRVVAEADDTVVLECRLPKDWIPRSERTVTSVAHPGTAVEWDGRWYEVVEAAARRSGGMRYTLAPWREHDVMRTAQRYDEATEKAREAARARRGRAEAARRWSIAMAPLSGHLPAAVQETMEAEYGAPAVLMSVASVVIPALYGLACLGWTVAERMRGDIPPVPGFLVDLGLVLLVESIVRFLVVVALGKPIGSALGHAAYSLAHVAAGRKPGMVDPLPRYEPLRGRQPVDPGPTPLRDRYSMMEPVLALLSPGEQLVLVDRFGFDPRRWGKRSAILLTVMTSAGVVSDTAGLIVGRRGFWTIASLLAALVLLVEQIARLSRLRSGPAGSVLAHLVRPFARPLLAREAEAPAADSGRGGGGETRPPRAGPS